VANAPHSSQRQRRSVTAHRTAPHRRTAAPHRHTATPQPPATEHIRVRELAAHSALPIHYHCVTAFILPPPLSRPTPHLHSPFVSIEFAARRLQPSHRLSGWSTRLQLTILPIPSMFRLCLVRLFPANRSLVKFTHPLLLHCCRWLCCVAVLPCRYVAVSLYLFVRTRASASESVSCNSFSFAAFVVDLVCAVP